MEQVPGSSGALLDSNHSHFLLVDNGTEDKYGVEIDLRSRFEEAVMKVKTDSRSSAGVSPRCLLASYLRCKGRKPYLSLKDSFFEHLVSYGMFIQCLKICQD